MKPTLVLKKNTQYDTISSVEMKSIVKPCKIISRKEAEIFNLSKEDEDQTGNCTHCFFGNDIDFLE